MENSKVTVCCLVYNHARFIRETMDGILMQNTNFEFDIVVHDDASTDGTEQILWEYKERYPDKITLLTEKENQYSKGGKIMKGMLLPKVTGKYYCICEGDDFWTDPNKLQRQYDALEAHPECSFSVHNVQCVDEESAPAGKVFPPVKLNPGVLTAEEYIGYEVGQSMWLFQTTCFLFRTDYLHEYLYDTPEFIDVYKKAGDLQRVLFYLTKGNVFYIDQFMSAYRIGVKGSVGERLVINKSFRINQRKGYIATLESYNEYTNGRFEKDIRSYQLRAEFGYLLDEGNYSAIKDPKFSEIYSQISAKQKIKITLFGIFPAGEQLYEKVKLLLWNIRHKR